MLIPYGKKPSTPEERRVYNQIIIDRGGIYNSVMCNNLYPGSIYLSY